MELSSLSMCDVRLWGEMSLVTQCRWAAGEGIEGLEQWSGLPLGRAEPCALKVTGRLHPEGWIGVAMVTICPAHFHSACWCLEWGSHKTRAQGSMVTGMCMEVPHTPLPIGPRWGRQERQNTDGWTVAIRIPCATI